MFSTSVKDASYYPKTGPVTDATVEPRCVLSAQSATHAHECSDLVNAPPWEDRTSRHTTLCSSRFLEMVKMNFDAAAKHTGLGVGMLEVSRR